MAAPDWIMRRGEQQAMYRYLPGRWIDFYIKSSRTSYAAYVRNWNSEPIEGVNTSRIKREVWNRLKKMIGRTDGFAPLDDENAWTVLRPKTGDTNSGIIAEVSPLFFICSNPACRKTRRFFNSNGFLRNYESNIKCKSCGSPMIQNRMIYYCPCGWAGPAAPKPTCSCNNPQLIQKSTYDFYCSNCHQEAEFSVFCPKCKHQKLMPRNALENAQFYPHYLSLIDLVDEKRESFISENLEGSYLTLAYWLGLLSRDRYQTALQAKMNGSVVEDVDSKVEAVLEQMKAEYPGMPEQLLRSMAEKMARSMDAMQNVRNAIDQAKALIPASANTNDAVRAAALKILEFDTIEYAEPRRSLSEAAEIAVELNEIDVPERYEYAMKRAKFSRIQASGKVPFVTAVYGYTRKNNEVKDDTTLCAFTPERTAKSNIYATRMETEGVLFELDRLEVLRWLKRNNVISEDIDQMSDAEVKAWFMRSCDESLISSFGEIEEENSRQALTSVFELLHTISHQLIRQAAALSGLDKSSLSEYIFCNIPAIFIYCQSSQGSNLGAMFSAMEAQLSTWIETAMTEVDQCIFDPVCKNEKGACAGCLFLNDISCRYMNKHLDRRLLIGYTDSQGRHLSGFWEE